MPTITIQTNISALRSQENSRKAQAQLGEAIRRLSSGLRVNSAADNAAGQAIANRFTASIKGLTQAARNANDGISMVATAEGALDEINERLHRIRQLTVQGLSGSYNQGDRDAIQAEINLNLKEIDRIVQQTQFNGKYLLDGTLAALGLQIGAEDGNVLQVNLGPEGFGVTALGLEDYYISGIAGEVLDIHELTGPSVNIHLLDDRTTTRFFNLTGTSELNLTGAKFVAVTEGGSMLGSNGFATKALDNNGDVIVYGAYQHSGLTTTVDRQSEVQVRTSLNDVYFKRADAVGAHAISNANLSFNRGGIAMAGTPELLQGNDGALYIRAMEGGETFYYSAELDLNLRLYDVSAPGVGHLGTAQAVGDTRYSTQTFTEAGIVSAALSEISQFTWVDGSGDPLAGDEFRLVKADDVYYVEVTTEDTSTSPSTVTQRYFRADIEWDLEDNSLVISAGTENIALSTASVADVSELPDIDLGQQSLFKSGASQHFYLQTDADNGLYRPVDKVSLKLDATGNVIQVNTEGLGLERKGSFNDANLGEFSVGKLDLDTHNVEVPFGTLYLGRVGASQGYYLYESLSPGGESDQFSEALLSVHYDASGTITDLKAIAAGTVPTKLNENVIVSGQAVVDLDTPLPPNVQVRYVDSTGKIFNDVLGKDADGNYILRLGDSAGSTYRTATLVQVGELEDYLISEKGDILVRTVNGTGEVIIYQKMTYTSLTDADADDTLVVITESGQEIRLRHPRNPLAAVDEAMAKVDGMRSYLGAIQNRLYSAINGLKITANNLTAARSRIMDADYVAEVSNMTRGQIIQQAAVSVLAQANQIPQTVLSLLR